MTITLKPELYEKLKAGKNVITPLFVLHPLAGYPNSAYFYNKKTGYHCKAEVKLMLSSVYGKVVK